MSFFKNRLKEKLLRGEGAFGLFYAVGSPDIAEMLAFIGFDYLLLDCEHSTITPPIAAEIYRAAELHGMSTVTRIGENSQQVIQKFVDAGSQGVLIPLIHDAEDAQRVVDAVKYPPDGKRGVAGARPAGMGYGDIVEHMRSSNEETLVAIQIETKEAVEQFDEIVRLPFIDVFFFGRMDLSVSVAGFGQPGGATERDSPEIVALVEKLGRRVIEAGKIAGTQVGGLDDYKRWREKGFQFLTGNGGRLLAEGPRGILREVREYEKSSG